MTVGDGALSPVAGLEFRFPWRPYQSRVLAAVDLHLADRRLHVVAAPGAGKTTLGLEVFRRLGRRCLVLSPTRVIRDQWIARLKDFVADDDWPLPWTSLDLDRPGLLTSVTYQAVHTRLREAAADDEEEELEYSGEAPDVDEVDDFVEHLRAAMVEVLILDEAHHLRDEWWRALTRIVDQIEGLTLVALTATPPYDVTNHEWSKYQELCGPIDEEISIPELVKAGTLCPHQDLVWLVELSGDTSERVRRYDDAVAEVCDELRESPLFLAAVSAHPWLAVEQAAIAESVEDPEGPLMDSVDAVAAEVLGAPELAFGLLIYLAHRKQPLPGGLLGLLEVEAAELPEMDRRWWQVLVHGFLFDASFALSAEQKNFRDALAKRLRARELLVRRDLRLNESGPMKRLLGIASEKIQGCVDIHQLERGVRGQDLRQVILTDYIRDEAGIRSLHGEPETLGAWPVFREFLRRGDVIDPRRAAILTGRLTSVHRSHLPLIERWLEGENLEWREAPFHPDFVVLDASLQLLTSALTALLGQGHIHLLVGTRALLGEGWDAPAVNSLVLATFVGSFMLTNQMRGRAIRTDRDDPDKIASIWHIVAIDNTTETGSADLVDLRQRFDTFVGLHEYENVIEGGLKRLWLPCDEQVAQAMVRAMGSPTPPIRTWDTNDEMRRRLPALPLTAARWREATAEGQQHRTAPSVQTAPIEDIKSLHFANTLRALMLEIAIPFGAAGSLAAGLFYVSPRYYEVVLIIVALVTIVRLLVVLPRAIRVFRFWWRHLPIDGSINQIALALKDALSQADLIQADTRQLAISCLHFEGTVTVFLVGASFYEQSLFADSLNELLGPVKNPRYLITREARGRVDYHAVPSALGVQKDSANLLHQAWLKRVGRSELIYTRRRGGRQQLLKARAQTFSNNYLNTTERIDRWQ